ncbi:MAG TPA: hypothetical protein VHO02_01945 [Fibrobacteria bacterium]|jgi:hypothetical protein|nr:hypothetical protein [Fibrobacteria bacterium]
MSVFRRLATLLAIFAAVFIMACNSTDSAATSESEPNNNADKADKITVGTTLTAEIQAEGDGIDKDYYKFKAEAGETYLIRTRYTSDSTDTKMSLWDFAGDDVDPLDQNDDIDEDGEDYNAGIEWTCETSGTYYFIVSGFEDDEEGSYKVSVTKE